MSSRFVSKTAELPGVEASIIQFTGRQTLAWNVSPGDYIVWVRWKNLFDAKSGVGIMDFWEIREGDEVSITSNIEDLPAWFELHPSEVSGYRACRMMQKKLDNGYKPGAPVEGPNLWRVMVGDRIVWISGVDAQDKNPTRTLVAFGECASLWRTPYTPKRHCMVSFFWCTRRRYAK